MADNARISDNSFVITWENFSQAMDWIAEKLVREKAEPHEIYVMQLLVEETFQRFAKHDKNPQDFSLIMSWQKSFHRVKFLRKYGDHQTP